MSTTQKTVQILNLLNKITLKKVSYKAICYCLLNDKKIRSKGLVQGPGVQKTFRLSSRTPEQFNVIPRTFKNLNKGNTTSQTGIIQNNIF